LTIKLLHPREKFAPIFFLRIFVFELGDRAVQTDGRTGGRTGKTRNVP